MLGGIPDQAYIQVVQPQLSDREITKMNIITPSHSLSSTSAITFSLNYYNAMDCIYIHPPHYFRSELPLKVLFLPLSTPSTCASIAVMPKAQAKAKTKVDDIKSGSSVLDAILRPKMAAEGVYMCPCLFL